MTRTAYPFVGVIYGHRLPPQRALSRPHMARLEGLSDYDEPQSERSNTNRPQGIATGGGDGPIQAAGLTAHQYGPVLAPPAVANLCATIGHAGWNRAW